LRREATDADTIGDRHGWVVGGLDQLPDKYIHRA
jgi:hypothetical protein